jgi:hypothetical protein
MRWWAEGKKVGAAVSSTNVTVAGDMVRMAGGRGCWPYVGMVWRLEGSAKNTGRWQVVQGPGSAAAKFAMRKLSFGCVRKR